MSKKKTLKTFGYIWALIFFVVSYTHDMNAIFLIISICFVLSASFYPKLYTKTHLFQLQVKFGNIMAKINFKVIMLILFFFVFTPIGIFLRLFKKDLLSKKLDKKKKSYFVSRKDQPGSMSNQF